MSIKSRQGFNSSSFVYSQGFSMLMASNFRGSKRLSVLNLMADLTSLKLVRVPCAHSRAFTGREALRAPAPRDGYANITSRSLRESPAGRGPRNRPRCRFKAEQLSQAGAGRIDSCRLVFKCSRPIIEAILTPLTPPYLQRRHCRLIGGPGLEHSVFLLLYLSLYFFFYLSFCLLLSLSAYSTSDIFQL